MSRLEILTGGRLHFGLLAVRAAEGRQFGGCGLMIDGPQCRIDVSLSLQREIIAPPAWTERIEQILEAYRQFAGVCPPVRVEVVEAVPQHVGLGSGTQMALAVIRGVAQLAGQQDLRAVTLANVVGRGKRSAIGLHGFDWGGFIIEAGKRVDEISPVAVRLDFPPDWRFLLVRRTEGQGLSGAEEAAGFNKLKPMSGAVTDRLCRLLLLELLPAIHALDFDGFSEALSEYSRTVGDYFAKVQGGIFADPAMIKLAEWLHPRGLRGVAQTSWGPTVALACSSPDHAEAIRLRLADSPWSRCARQIVSPRNTGATVSRVS